jgi:hypothetical protein
MKNILVVCLLVGILFTCSLSAQDNNADSATVASIVSTLLGSGGPQVGFLGQFDAQINNTSGSTNSYYSFHLIRAYLFGNAGEKFKYSFQGDFTNAFTLMDLKLSYLYSDNLRLDFGQFKAPFGNEFMRHDANLTFVNRSTVACGLGTFRQQGVQVKYSSGDKRLAFAGGYFGGSGINTHDNLISLWSGKLTVVPFDGEISDTKVKLEVSGSSAYSHDVNDFSSLLKNTFAPALSQQRVLLLGSNARLTAGNTAIEFEGINALCDDIAAYGGMALDVIQRVNPEWEIAARYDRFGYYTIVTSSVPSVAAITNYVFGVNWYPIHHTKFMADFTQLENSNLKSFIVQFQYAINHEN